MWIQIEGLTETKRSRGRKEHIVVDTLGIPMAVAVHEANIHDSKGAPKVIEKLEHKFPRLRKILADGGYQGTLGDWVAGKFGWVVEVVFRPDECPSKFQVLPKRWIVSSFPGHRFGREIFCCAHPRERPEDRTGSGALDDAQGTDGRPCCDPEWESRYPKELPGGGRDYFIGQYSQPKTPSGKRSG